MGNFMTAGTELNDVKVKMDQCIQKAGNIISTAMIDKIRRDGVDQNFSKDIKNLLKDFSLEDRVDILLIIINNILKQVSVDSSGKPVKKKNESNSFLNNYFGKDL